jgi:hypothetical protein
LIEAARGLQTQRRGAGVWPYQWIFPGPNARKVNAGAGLTVPIAGAGLTTVISYTVPQGMRFTLRGVVVGFLGTGWTEGSDDLVFTLQVNAAGTRAVDYLNNVRTHLGSLESPYPILGTDEYDPQDELVWNCLESGAIPVAAANLLFAQIVGWEYPLSEAV